jgi:NAD(P)H-dependent FMN reductase
MRQPVHLGIAGSLHRVSYNRTALRVAQQLVLDDTTFYPM